MVKIALHLIENYYNLENELDMLSSLNESDDDIVPLFEHRGKPDPKKVREREEAHKRGIERHKNALDRERKEELVRMANKIKKQQEHHQKQEEEKKKQQQRQQQVHDAEQQKKQQQIHDTEQQKKQQDEIKKASMKTKQSKAQLDHTVKHMSATAPTTNTKRHAKSISKDVNDTNKQVVSAFAKLTPAERKRRKQREREEMAEKYDKIENKYLKKMRTPSERIWLKKNFAKIKRAGVGTADNIFDLMGYKAVYTDIADATKFILGKK